MVWNGITFHFLPAPNFVCLEAERERERARERERERGRERGGWVIITQGYSAKHKMTNTATLNTSNKNTTNYESE